MGEVIREKQEGGHLNYVLNSLFCFCYRKWWASSVDCLLFSLSHPVFRISRVADWLELIYRTGPMSNTTLQLYLYLASDY